MNRREFLKGAALTAGVAAGITTVSGSEAYPGTRYGRELDSLMAATSPYLATDPIPQQPLTRQQIASPVNPRLNNKPADTSQAIVVVHPGYFTKNVADYYSQLSKVSTDEDVLNQAQLRPSVQNADSFNLEDIKILNETARGREGDYGAYRQKLSSVFNYARQNPQVPLVVYREASAIAAAEEPHRQLLTPDHAITVSTVPDDPKPERTVRYRRSDGAMAEAPQDENLIFDWLRGVETVYMAGEYGLSRGGGFFPACAGSVALKLLQQEINVSGIEGAVFPTAPLDLNNARARQQATPEALAVATALYH